MVVVIILLAQPRLLLMTVTLKPFRETRRAISLSMQSSDVFITTAATKANTIFLLSSPKETILKTTRKTRQKGSFHFPKLGIKPVQSPSLT